MYPFRMFFRNISGKAIAGLIVASGAVGATDELRASETKSVDPITLYGDKLEFEVSRNGKPVGSHRVFFFEKQNAVLADTVFKIEISLLKIPLYNFKYESQGHWENGRLRSINVDVDDDGKVDKFAGFRLPNAFLINGKPQPLAKGTEIYPTNHWNNGVLSQSEVFNTLTGKINQVSIKNAGPEKVAVKGGSVTADRYVYSGDLEVESWYDSQGRWVKLRFKAEDDSLIDYMCTTCAPESESNG